MRHANNEISKATEEIEQPNQNRIRTVREKETYKDLEVNTIKQVDIKKRITKEYLRRTRKLPETKLNSRKFIKRDKYQGCPTYIMLGTILKMEEGKTSTNELENKKIHEAALGITSQR